MFYYCINLTSLDVSGFNTEKVTDMRSMFYYCSNLTSLDVSGFNTEKVTNMSNMFYNCSDLTSLDVSGFNTEKVTDMSNMFSFCNGLTSLDVSSFNTEKVTNMSYMFSFCNGLTSLDVSSFNTEKVTNMAAMFYGCSGLTSLDPSGFNTENVTNMSSMFGYCSNLTSLDVSGFNTEKVTAMRSMFYYCSNLTSLDVSGFNTEKVTDMEVMFSGSNNLSKVDLGPNFSFKGKNISSTTNMAILPTPPQNATTQKWIKEDESDGPYTAKYLRDNYNGESMFGIWVWQVNPNSCMISFDGNGGNVSAESITATSIDQSIMMPAAITAKRPHYTLSSWNTSADGTGTSYTPGSTYNDVVQLGDYITLYAQWAPSNLRKYKVKHYQQKTDLSNYALVETETFEADYDTQVTPQTKTYEGFVSPVAQTKTVLEDDSLVVEYKYNRGQYTIKLDGNGADSGQTVNIQMVYGIPETLPRDSFGKKGCLQSGWNTKPDGSGTQYTLTESVNNLGGDGDVITLYATWVDNSDNELNPANGSVIVQAKAGETVVIPDLPNGVSYTIEEINNPDGWATDSLTAGSGSIQANNVSASGVNNRYEATGEINIVAHKRLNGDVPAAGDYTFELLRNGRVVATATNDAVDESQTIDVENRGTIANPWYGTAPIIFDPIPITSSDIGTMTLIIREVAGENSNIEYDSHEETVTVNVSDAGAGMLSAEVVYDNDGPLFTNEVKTGSVEVTKTIENGENQEFPFVFNVSDAAENPIDNKVFSVEHFGPNYSREDVVKYSHMSNVDDAGNKLSNYSNYANFNQVITIPGAKELNITITYGGESASYDWACVWAGNHPNYRANNYYSSSISGKLGGGNHTAASNTKTYKINGDSVTFGFYSNRSGVGDGYGFYAVITGTAINDYSSSQIQNGDSFTVPSGGRSVIRDIPDGATYILTESDTPGWTQTSAENAEGTITADQTTHATFTNRYSSSGSFSPELSKEYIGGSLAEETFDFELLDEEMNVIQAAQSDASGSVSFNPIEYTQDDVGRTFTYYAREVAGTDESMDYDPHTETITVTLTDDGAGNITATPTYSNNGEFVNSKRGNLTISKTVTGSMGSRDKDFRFSVTFGNHSGAINYTKEKADGTKENAAIEAGTNTQAFTLSHGDSITFKDIPCSTTYDVKEIDANDEAYTTTATAEGSTVTTDPLDKEVHVTGTLDGDCQAAFTNARDVAVPTTSTRDHFKLIAGILIITGIFYGIFKRKQKRRAANR